MATTDPRAPPQRKLTAWFGNRLIHSFNQKTFTEHRLGIRATAVNKTSKILPLQSSYSSEGKRNQTLIKQEVQRWGYLIESGQERSVSEQRSKALSHADPRGRMFQAREKQSLKTGPGPRMADMLKQTPWTQHWWGASEGRTVEGKVS